MTARGIFGIALAAASTAAVIGGLLVVGPPGEARLKRLDERRVSDLTTVNNLITVYWDRHKALPATLADAQTTAGWSASTNDPVTGETYPYRVIEGRKYELCATFDRPSEAPPSSGAFWSHTSGRQCFPMEVKERNH